MLLVAVVLDPRYRLKYVKFWFREWYEKDKGYAMSSKVRDALKRLYMERVGQNGVLSSSGSGSGASLSRDSRPSVSKQHSADEDNVEFDLSHVRLYFEICESI